MKLDTEYRLGLDRNPALKTRDAALRRFEAIHAQWMNASIWDPKSAVLRSEMDQAWRECEKLRVMDQIRRECPESYWTPGVGYCGPKFERARELWNEFRVSDGSEPMA